MQSLGVILVGEKYVRVTGFQLLDGGIKRRFDQSTSIHHNLLEAVAEMMLAGEHIAHGEWLVVVPAPLFRDRRAFNNSIKQLKITIGNIHVKTLSREEIWDEILDWTAVNFFSMHPVVT